MSESTKYRAWLFTSYAEERPRAERIGAQFLVVQREECPTTRRLHWQGYAYFKNPRSLGGVKKVLPGAHLEPRRGSHDQAVEYCSKQETRVDGPYIEGDPPSQGSRTDVRSFAEAILNGRRDHDLATEFPVEFLKFGRYRADLRMASQRPRSWKTTVVVLHGPSGCGKSRWAHERWPEAYTKDPTNDWWDGYQGEEVVIFDEFYGGMRHDAMLKIMDRYPLRVQIKGGYVNFSAKLVIITSNADPREWYSSIHSKAPESRVAFFRRIEHEITFSTGNGWLTNRNSGRIEPEIIDDPDWTEIDLQEFKPVEIQRTEEPREENLREGDGGNGNSGI